MLSLRVHRRGFFILAFRVVVSLAGPREGKLFRSPRYCASWSYFLGTLAAVPGCVVLRTGNPIVVGECCTVLVNRVCTEFIFKQPGVQAGGAARRSARPPGTAWRASQPAIGRALCKTPRSHHWMSLQHALQPLREREG